MLENIDLTLVFIALGALAGILLVFVEGYQAYNKYVVPKKNEKRATRKEELTSAHAQYTNTRSSLERSLKDYVMTNKFTEGWHSYPSESLSSDLKKRIQKWNEIYERCGDWKVASESEIIVRLQELSQKNLRTTFKDYPDLLGALNSDGFRSRYFEGEEVTKLWIEQNNPTLHETIMDHLKGKKAKLGMFFLNLNATFKENRVLNRFRREKKELIELGQQIIEDLKIEEEKLQNELERYKDIEIEKRIGFEQIS